MSSMVSTGVRLCRFRTSRFTLIVRFRCTPVNMTHEVLSLFQRMPRAVLQNIASFLDFVSWYSIQSIDPGWRVCSPSSLTFVDSVPSEDFWESSITKSHCRFHSICGDSFYGGVVKPGGSCGVLIRMLRLRPKCFIELTNIDLTAQCQHLYQVASLFSARTIALFPSLRSLALRLVVDSSYPHGGQNFIKASAVPPNLEVLILRITCCLRCGNNALDSLHPLIMKVKRLQWIIEDDPVDKFLSFFPWPLSSLQYLETLKPIIDRMFLISRNNLQTLMPNLVWIAIHTAGNTSAISGIHKINDFLKTVSHPESVVRRSCADLVRCERVTLTERIEYKACNMIIPANDLSAMGNLANVTVFSLRCSSWNLETLKCLEFFPLLASCSRLVDLTLPRELLMAWSKDVKFREEFVALSRVYSIASVRRLHFASSDLIVNVNSVSSPQILGGESCDSIFANVFRMFPNIRTLIIDPVPYFHCGSAFLHLVTFTNLKKLLITHSRRLRFDASTRRLGLSKWLPRCETLEVLILYTQQFNWLEERTESGLLLCLQKNQSLRYVCIICELSRGSESISLTMADVARVANCWEHRKSCHGKYVIFIFNSTNALYCLTAKPKIGRSDNGHSFERREFYRWMDLISAYPELYSVFWSDLTRVLKTTGAY